MTSSSIEEDAVIAEARAAYTSLLGAFQSVVLGTVNASGEPDASYAPAIVDEQRNLYVYISALSSHTGNIKQSGKASALIIEDETLSKQIFARRRATFQCRAEHIERRTPEWEARLDDFEDKFGKLVDHLRTMKDFDLFRLVPRSGRLVTGFGRAFDLSGEAMEVIEHVGGAGQGHTSEKDDA
jgi:putative heme iron utilization protein